MKPEHDNSEENKDLQTQAMYLIAVIGAVAGLVLNSPSESITANILKNTVIVQNLGWFTKIDKILPDIEYVFLIISIISLSIAFIFAVMAFDFGLNYTDRERKFKNARWPFIIGILFYLVFISVYVLRSIIPAIVIPLSTLHAIYKSKKQ